MEKEHLHGYLSPTLPPLNQKTIHTLNYQAAQDFSKRSIPGAFIILLLMISCLYSSTVFNDAQILISILLSLLSLSVFSRFFIIKDLKNHLHDKKLNQWKQIFSLAVLLTAFVWGIFASINFYLYGLNTAVLIIFMFTIAIAGGSAISLFIWKRLAHVYLALLLLPICIIAIIYWKSSNAIIIFSFMAYFIFLYFQINRSNREYWLASCNTQLLEIHAKELIISKENAEKANQAKSEFLSSMSHELRTPLNAVLGFTQLLIEDPDEPPTPSQEESLGYIQDSGNHLLTLISQVLNLAKIESGKLSPEIKTVSLAQIIAECSPMIQAMAQKNNITLTITENINYSIHADYMFLKQILINFLSNGIKYNKPNGSLKLTCQKNTDTIKVEITDTGMGISPEHQENLFTPFSRLGHENSTIEGSGVGLAIAKNLIESMHGELGFSSIEGQGSTFWFELPLPEN